MFFIPQEDRIKIDLHGLDVEQALFCLEDEIENALSNIKAIVIVHGYNKSKIMEAIYNEFTRSFTFKNYATKIERTINPGVSIIYLKDYLEREKVKNRRINKRTKKIKK